MYEGTGITKHTVAIYGVIPTLLGVSFDTGEFVTNCLETYVFAVEASTAKAKLAMSILVELTYIGFHVHKQR